MGPLASRESSDARAQRKRSTTSGRPTANTALPAPVAANSANRPGTTSATRSGTDYRPGKSLTRYLPQVAVATLLVSVMPIIVVWLLRSAGAIGPWTCLVLAMAISTVLSWVGCAYWKRSQGSGDLLFSELLVWEWLRRWRAERRLASAIDLLGLVQTSGERPAGLSVDRQEQLLRVLAAALEAEDRYTRGHSDRVARYAGSIGRRMGLSTREVEAVRAAALVHDVGKLRIPAEVLNKPTRLTDAEFDLIKRHPVDGAEMVTSLGNEELTSVVRHHHERMDGKGYPDGLAGEQIPLGARIIAVADTFDAITSVRPYRPRRAHKQALDILTAEQGLQLDREAVRAFLHCYSGRRSIALWTVSASVLQRAVSWMTGEATAATITTGNVVATAVATVAIGGVAMTSAVVARVDPSRPAGNAHASARPGHAPLGQGLGVPEAGGPAGGPPLARGLLSVHGPGPSVRSAVGVGRRHPSHTRHAAHRVLHTHGIGKSHARRRLGRGDGHRPSVGKTVLGRSTGTSAAPRHAARSNGAHAGSSRSARARSTDSGHGKGSRSATSRNATGAGGVRVPVVVAPSPLPEPHSGPQRPSGQERSAETAIGRRRPDLRKGTDTPGHQARSSLSNALLAVTSSDPGLTCAIALGRRQPT